MDINYKKVTNVQNPAFIRQQKPLDIRTYVNTLDETDTIQNPYIGLMFYCGEDGEYYKVTELKSGLFYLDDELVYPSKKSENDEEYKKIRKDMNDVRDHLDKYVANPHRLDPSAVLILQVSRHPHHRKHRSSGYNQGIFP